MSIPRIVLLAALAALALAPPAGALGVNDVELLSFPSGGANTGLTNSGLSPDFAIDPTMQQVCTGAGVFQTGGACMGRTSYAITIGQNLQTVHQNPQARRTNPSDSGPFIADSLWTATNTSGETYAKVLLLFTSVQLMGFPGAINPGGYPDLEVGLDGNLLDIVRFTWVQMGTQMEAYFAAVDLGPLAPGDSRQFTVRYIVSSGPMPIVNNNVVMPPLKLLSVVVPEPASLALLLTGLAGIAFAGRAR